MNLPSRILVVSSELESRRTLVAILNEKGCGTVGVSRVRDCREVLAAHDIQLVFCERLLTDGTYRDVIAAAQSTKRPVRVIVTSRVADWDEYGDALREGAFDLIPSPCESAEVMRAIAQASQQGPSLIRRARGNTMAVV